MNKQKLLIMNRTYTRDVPVKDYQQRVQLTDAVYQLYLINRKLQRLNEIECDGIAHIVNNRIEMMITDDDQRMIDRMNQYLEDKANKLAKEYGFFIRVQGDPRGSAIKLDLLSDESIDYIGHDTDLVCKA